MRQIIDERLRQIDERQTTEQNCAKIRISGGEDEEMKVNTETTLADMLEKMDLTMEQVREGHMIRIIRDGKIISEPAAKQRILPEDLIDIVMKASGGGH